MQKERLDEILAHGVQCGASDLHFKVASPPTYRIDGVLRPIQHDPLSPTETLAIAKILAGRVSDGTDLLERQECDTSYSVSGVARFRANVYVQRGSLCCVLRVIPSQVPTLEHLGLPARVSGLAEEERGIVLVTGATGSGKSSTLAAIVQHINERRSVHILTIEDPIEFLYENRVASISQREVGTDTRNFATALRAALRQDPDVILVGEMRDRDDRHRAQGGRDRPHGVLDGAHDRRHEDDRSACQCLPR
jgi:twitching motility protein PilT